MPDAFFEPTGDPGRFVATDHCAGSWSPTLQHAGPPSALLVRAVEALDPSFDAPPQVTRFAVDILGPVPIGKVNTHASAILRIVESWSPDPLAAMVPATPDDRTWVVDTGNPYISAAAIVPAATSSADAP